jgi:hypothetical protein
VAPVLRRGQFLLLHLQSDALVPVAVLLRFSGVSAWKTVVLGVDRVTARHGGRRVAQVVTALQSYSWWGGEHSSVPSLTPAVFARVSTNGFTVVFACCIYASGSVVAWPTESCAAEGLVGLPLGIPARNMRRWWHMAGHRALHLALPGRYFDPLCVPRLGPLARDGRKRGEEPDCSDDIGVPVRNGPVLRYDEPLFECGIAEHTTREHKAARVAGLESALCEYGIEEPIIMAEELDALNTPPVVVAQDGVEQQRRLANILRSMQEFTNRCRCAHVSSHNDALGPSPDV